MDVNHPMISQTMNIEFEGIPPFQLECFSCGEPATIEELLLVDHLIEASPCFADISETFSHCIGVEHEFHGNVVNCCAACYAAIVQTVAPCADTTRFAEIENLVSTLRSRPDVHATIIITLERLLAGLIDVGRAYMIEQEDLAEALYCKTSPLYSLLP
jgi:hypothetical protein